MGATDATGSTHTLIEPVEIPRAEHVRDNPHEVSTGSTTEAGTTTEVGSTAEVGMIAE